MQLIDEVRRFIRQRDLAGAETRVAAAVSGGPDSAALAHLLHELDSLGDVRFAAIAHFNHQLRRTANDDERFCGQLAERLGVPFVADRAEVREVAARENRSLEDAAHQLRYAFFERARRAAGCDVVAVGHTRDDQAETFLLRLIRGAGARGLAGMHPRNGSIIRPLLGARRRDVHEYLAARGLPFVRDESNDDVAIPRNRVRTELVPVLESRFNPSIVDVLGDEADVAREEWLWLESQAGHLWARACRVDGRTLRIDAGEIGRAPLALARIVVRRALVEASGGLPISFDHVETVLRLASQQAGSLDAPRQLVERLGPDIVLTGRAADAVGRPVRDAQGQANFFHYSLSIPGEVTITEAGCALSAEAAESASAASATASTGRVVCSAVVPLAKCDSGLAVRNRRPGDRFRPAGLGGAKKLQDYFVDKKIARAERDKVPIVVDSSDRIVWVGGHAIDEAFRVTDPKQAVLVLKLKKSRGGPA